MNHGSSVIRNHLCFLKNSKSKHIFPQWDTPYHGTRLLHLPSSLFVLSGKSYVSVLPHSPFIPPGLQRLCPVQRDALSASAKTPPFRHQTPCFLTNLIIAPCKCTVQSEFLHKTQKTAANKIPWVQFQIPLNTLTPYTLYDNLCIMK